MIGVVDYGLGNVEAFLNAYHRLHIPASKLTNPSMFDQVDRLILPGVGSFDWAMQQLFESGMKEALDKSVLINRKPILGVCVGMQMMANKSSEGNNPGLGWIDMQVSDFHSVLSNREHAIPHMGWNSVAPHTSNGLFKGLDSESRFYFLHAYYFESNTKECLATTNFGISFASSVSCANAFGVQFHPEKSHGAGLKLLKNFAIESF
jgi:imidazole glycerol-phosphate synthase subunit HisH